MRTRDVLFSTLSMLVCVVAGAADLPGPVDDGYLLPNGWRITPFGDVVEMPDLILNLQPSPDGRVMVAIHCGFNDHGLVTIDAESNEAIQRIKVPTAWYGLAWSPDGSKLYVSGGNNSSRKGVRAPVYVFDYADGTLSDEPVQQLMDDVDPKNIYWAGLVHHPTAPRLFAANRTSGDVVVFDTESGAIIKRIRSEVNPYSLVLNDDASKLYCSNWGSDSVSVIDVESLAVETVIGVGDNPNDMVLAKDGRLFVACSNDNTVTIIDTKLNRAAGSIVTSMYPNAPEGSTPNALALDPDHETLYIANGDNNNVCVVNVDEAGEEDVLGFIPAGWYPSAVAVSPDGGKLYIGNGKGGSSSANPTGPLSPIRQSGEKSVTVKTSLYGTVNIIDVEANRSKLRALTKQVYDNCPYNDELLAAARPPKDEDTIVPSRVGAGSPIKHVIYIIKENRTYDQVFGDMPQGNGDPRLTVFGEEITPNHHALAEQFVLFDNLYCDAEVSVDGHQWSNAAYATDFIEKLWPASYGGKSNAPYTEAATPASGYLWDQCARKGLTYRSYGEYARRVSEDGPMDGRVPGLVGHVAPNYLNWGARDFENAAEFIKEFDVYEANFDSSDPSERLPNFIVMGLPEDHTKGSRPGAPTVQAAVASNDNGLGMIIERVTHSKYWPDLAVFVIEDDAQNGPDHVDARRTIGLVVSPYAKRGIVDSTFYTTSSMLRTIELMLGLQPMSQFDAAATPMYAAFSNTADKTPYDMIEPRIDIHAVNDERAWGARESLAMDLSDYDRAPMFPLNEIIWKNVKGAESEMPLPVHRFHAASLE